MIIQFGRDLNQCPFNPEQGAHTQRQLRRHHRRRRRHRRRRHHRRRRRVTAKRRWRRRSRGPSLLPLIRRRRRHLTRVRGDHRPGFRRRGEPEPRGAGHGQLEALRQKRPEIGVVDI